VRIAVDAFGSDKAPFPEIEGAIQAIKEDYCDQVILVGDEAILHQELDKYYFDQQRLTVLHASQKIGMEDNAANSVRSKKDSSMVKAVSHHKSGEADAVVSAGNSGAFMTASLLTYGRISGVLRPAIAVNIPTQQGYEILLDMGANVDCAPEHLVQFAQLGSIYYTCANEATNPRVALLNIGEESAKGNSVTRGAHKLLSGNKTINFIGNIEGKDVLRGICEVVVCDGFVGNVVLKTIEGALISIFDILKEQFDKDWIAKFGAMLSYPVFSYITKKLDHTEYGGALLVGLNGVSIVSHGRSNGKAIKNAIKLAARISQANIVQHTKEYFERLQ